MPAGVHVRWRTVTGGFSWKLAGVVAAAVVLLGVAPVSSSATNVFVHSAASGELRNGRLALHGVSGRVTWISNAGRSGVVHVRRLHRRLFSDATRPATGTLHIAGHRGGDELAFRLRRPRYDGARDTVSYRVRRIGKRARSGRNVRSSQSSSARQFGAASLSIVGHPRVMGGDNGGNDCPTGVVNQTGYGLQPISASKWDTDTWSPAPDPDRAVSSTGGGQSETYESDGGFLRGCSNNVVWDLVLDPKDPARHIPPDGTFTVNVTQGWSQVPSRTCVSSNPQFVCQAAGDNWVIRPS
jgi:hypothetical protein